MGIALRPANLRRYRDIAGLLLKYGNSDLVRQAGLEDALGDLEEPSAGGAGAGELASDLERLGPTFIKLGQLLSTRPDLLPGPYLDALQRLQDRVEPIPCFEIEEIFESELGVRISKAFSEFDERPLAAASLGQVHRAVMRDGRQVAVKVQRPHIRKRVADDLEALGEIAEFLDRHTRAGRRFQFAAMFDEFRRSLVGELDYRREARNLLAIGESLEKFDRIVVPQPVDDFTTSRVLTMDYVRGRNISRLGPLARLEVDGSELAEELFRAYLKQILVDGLFHTDPHPGNVLMTDDDRLALIDLGQVARIGPQTQEDLLQLMMAVAEGRSDDAARVAVRIGERTEEFDERAFGRSVADLVGEQHQATTLGQIEVGRLMLEVTNLSGRSGLRLPVELTMLGKALLNLDQVAWQLDPDFEPNAAIQRVAPQLMRERLSRDISPGNFFSGVLELRDALQQMPRRINRIMDAVANNEVELRVHAFDETRLLAGMHKIANRITVGLVLSALIVGAALLMRVETPFRIVGYPGLAIICFLLAAGGGLVLLVRILTDDV
jgi:ubiquinone biosynthesis protein